MTMASPTPPVTIPRTLFDVYWQYKTSTAVVLKWPGDNEAITSQTGVTISQLQIAAESVCVNNIQVPEAIYRMVHRFRTTSEQLSASAVVSRGL